jgi:hypothetical protein
VTLDPLSKATYLSARARRLFEELLSAPRVLIGAASPPAKNGVYAFSIGDEIVYVGEAKGSSGLNDRILKKHVSGDEGHALQAAFCEQFPNRLERRTYIKSSIYVQWVEIPDSLEVLFVETLAIAVLGPRLNQSVVRRSIR